MTPKPQHPIAGDDHEEESPLLLRQEESSSEDSFHLEIISPTATTKSPLDETRTQTHIHTSEPVPLAGLINSTTNPDDIKKSTRKRIILISLLALFIVLLEFGMTFISTPLYQIQEDIICRQFLSLPGDNVTYLLSADPSSSMSAPMLIRSSQNTNTTSSQDSSPSPSPEDCKSSPPTQSEFSIITSWYFVLQLLPGLVMAVPMGLLADKHGRTLVMALSMAGMTLNFGFSVLICSYPDFFGGSLRWIWAGSLFGFLGGGMTVFSAMVFSMLSDVSGEGERSTAFSYLTAGMHAGAIIAPPATYYLMKVLGDWTTIYIGLSILVLATLFASCLPETLKTKNQDDHGPNPFENTSKLDLKPEQLISKIQTSLLRFRDFLKLLHTNLLLLLTSILLTTFGRDAQTVLLQYVTVKFGWSWGEAGLITSIQSIATLILLTVLLPLASYLLFNQHQDQNQRQHKHQKRSAGPRLIRRILRIKGPSSRDLALARISITLQTIGAFLTGLAPSAGILIPSVVVSSLGQGFNLLIRGLMTSLLLSSSSSSSSSSDQTATICIEAASRHESEMDTETVTACTEGKADENEKDNHIALLNSTIAWVETAGAMIATPLLAGSFRLGLSWGAGIWTGLPFFLAGCLFLSATFIVLFVTVRFHDHDHHDHDNVTAAAELGHEEEEDPEDGRRTTHGSYTAVNQHV
ncbi:Major facilitator superfamily domain containing protein [Naviculisporaceae sp. PSN 640]